MNPGLYKEMLIQRGGTFSLSLTAKDDLGEINFAEKYTKARMLIYPAWIKPGATDPGEPLDSFTTENNRIAISATNLDIQMSSTDTALLTFSEGSYRLELIDETVTPAKVDPILEGIVTVMEGGQ